MIHSIYSHLTIGVRQGGILTILPFIKPSDSHQYSYDEYHTHIYIQGLVFIGYCFWTNWKLVYTCSLIVHVAVWDTEEFLSYS